MAKQKIGQARLTIRRTGGRPPSTLPGAVDEVRQKRDGVVGLRLCEEAPGIASEEGTAA